MRRRTASFTSSSIARLTLMADANPAMAGLLPPRAAAVTSQLLEATGGWRRWMRPVVGSRTGRAVTRLGERAASAPGFVLHVALRKRFVTDEVEAALAGGARQLLVVGAGLDSLAVRMADAHPDVPCVELDHPVTQAAKRDALDATGLARPNLHLVAADLAELPVDAALADIAGWDRDAPGVAVAEGLLMYLDDDAVRALFRGLGAVGVTTVVFTWLHGDDRGRAAIRGAHRLSFQAIGEPVRWAASPAALRAILADAGFELVLDDAGDLRRRYLVGTPLADAPLSDVERVARAVRIGR